MCIIIYLYTKVDATIPFTMETQIKFAQEKGWIQSPLNHYHAAGSCWIEPHRHVHDKLLDPAISRKAGGHPIPNPTRALYKKANPYLPHAGKVIKCSILSKHKEAVATSAASTHSYRSP